MNVFRIVDSDAFAGEGLRTVVYVAGCNHACPFCYNRLLWNPNIGQKIDEDVIKRIDDDLDNPNIDGVTFFGGEVTYPPNRADATKLMAYLKKRHPTKTNWTYTGYLFEQIKDLEMMKYIDVLVDGPYVQRLNYGIGKSKWRGSANQRIILVQESLKQNKIVYYRDFDGTELK